MYSLTGDGISQKLIELSEINSSASEIDTTIAKVATIQNVSDVVVGLTVTGEEISEAVPSVKNKVDLTFGKNLFNISDSGNELGKWVSEITGLTPTNSSYNATGFIEIKASTQYSLSYKHNIAYYDKDKTFISGSSSTITSKQITTPSNATYIRCTVLVANWATFQLELGAINTPFIAYVSPYVTLNTLLLPNNTVMFETTKNLFVNRNTKDGFFINVANGRISSSATLFASDYIEVIEGQSYILSGNSNNTNYSAWYDSNYVFISGDNNSYPKTAPANAKYIRISSVIANKSITQLEVGTEITGYLPSHILKEEYYKNGNIKRNINKKWGSLGDSITFQAKWQYIPTYDFSLVYTNYGVNGTLVTGNDVTSFSQGTRVASMSSSLDIVSVMGGTNDWIQNIALGTITDTTNSTFYGALDVLINLLLTKYPTKRIFFMTPPYGEKSDYLTRGWINSYTNTQGLTTRDYAEAVKAVCYKYNIPCLDVNAQCGWNNKNIINFAADYTHPNTLGGGNIGRLVSDFMDRL